MADAADYAGELEQLLPWHHYLRRHFDPLLEHFTDAIFDEFINAFVQGEVDTLFYCAETAERLGPNSPFAYLLLGMAYWQAEDYPETIRYFELLMLDYPNSWEANYLQNILK